MVLNRKLFIWNVNDFCKRFREKKTALEFSEEWSVWRAETGAKSNEDEVASVSDEVPPAKKPCMDDSHDDPEKWMDEIDYEIQKHKVGMYYCWVEGIEHSYC